MWCNSMRNKVLHESPGIGKMINKSNTCFTYI